MQTCACVYPCILLCPTAMCYSICGVALARRGIKWCGRNMEVSGRGVEMNVEVRRDEWGVEVSEKVEASVKMGVRQVRSMAVHVDEPTHTPGYMYHQVYAWV